MSKGLDGLSELVEQSYLTIRYPRPLQRDARFVVEKLITDEGDKQLTILPKKSRYSISQRYCLLVAEVFRFALPSRFSITA